MHSIKISVDNSKLSVEIIKQDDQGNTIGELQFDCEEWGQEWDEYEYEYDESEDDESEDESESYESGYREGYRDAFDSRTNRADEA